MEYQHPEQPESLHEEHADTLRHQRLKVGRAAIAMIGLASSLLMGCRLMADYYADETSAQFAQIQTFIQTTQTTAESVPTEPYIPEPTLPPATTPPETIPSTTSTLSPEPIPIEAFTAVSNPPNIADLWHGRAQFVPDDQIHTGVTGHAETSTIFQDGQYVMAYRTFQSLDGQTCVIPTGIAIATSPDGVHFTPVDNGQPRPGLGSTGEPGCPDAYNSVTKYAPDMERGNDGSIWLAYEQRAETTPLPAGQHHTYMHEVRMVRSYDGGRTWQDDRVVVPPDYGNTASWNAEVGTPDLVVDGAAGDGQCLIYFHATGFQGEQRYGFTRNLAIQASPCSYEGAYNLHPANPIIASSESAPFGIGLSHITSNRQADGWYYMIAEAWKGQTGLCGTADEVSLVLGRSQDLVSWEFRPEPVVAASHNDSLACGGDMPNWFITTDGLIRVITTNDPPETQTLRTFSLKATQ